MTEREPAPQNPSIAELAPEREPADERILCQPGVDIAESGDGLVLRADLPGVHKEALELSIEDRILTIYGRATVEMPDGAVPVLHEYRFGDFFRSFILGEDVDVEKIEAKLLDGVLTVRMPRREVQPKRTIPVE